MPDEKRNPSELIAAAKGFDEELLTFGKLTEAVRGLPLNSQKSLQRAARLFQEIGESDARLGAAGQGLVAAIKAARERQQAHAEEIQERAQQIQERTAIAADLLGRYSALGEEAAQINALAREVMSGRREESQAPNPELHSSLLQLYERLSQVVGSAQALTEAARKAGFEDIARQADSLHQQLLVARKKIGSLSSVDRGVGQA